MSRKRGSAGDRHADDDLPAAATVTAVARMVGLSRERFYQLVRDGVFPEPHRDGDGPAKRPYYTEAQQRVCIAVRRRGVGMNGKIVMFNEKRRPAGPKRLARRQDGPATAAEPPLEEWLAEGVVGLGLDVTKAQVLAARQACYPDGVNEEDRGIVIGNVFRHLYGRRHG